MGPDATAILQNAIEKERFCAAVVEISNARIL
jgi:hypothetical protein